MFFVQIFWIEIEPRPHLTSFIGDFIDFVTFRSWKFNSKSIQSTTSSYFPVLDLSTVMQYYIDYEPEAAQNTGII